MRKIKSMADIERVQRRNNIILGVFMIVLLVGSSLGYSLMSADSEEVDVVSENGFDFVRDGGMWRLVIDGEVFGTLAYSTNLAGAYYFQYLPSEVSEIDVGLNVQLGMYSGQPLYFVNPGEGAGEILGNIGGYVLRYQEACLASDVGSRESGVGDLGNLTMCEGDLPIKDCSSNLIVFEQGNETRVYDEGNCVFIIGDVLKGSDAFLYEVLGVN